MRLKKEFTGLEMPSCKQKFGTTAMHKSKLWSHHAAEKFETWLQMPLSPHASLRNNRESYCCQTRMLIHWLCAYLAEKEGSVTQNEEAMIL